MVNVYINYEKKFAFVEFRTVEETSNAMGLDGIMFEGVSVSLPMVVQDLLCMMRSLARKTCASLSAP